MMFGDFCGRWLGYLDSNQEQLIPSRSLDTTRRAPTITDADQLVCKWIAVKNRLHFDTHRRSKSRVNLVKNASSGQPQFGKYPSRAWCREEVAGHTSHVGEFEAWLGTSIPIAFGVFLAAIPGVAVAVLNDRLARRRENARWNLDRKRDFALALGASAVALTDLAEVRLNPERNSQRDGAVTAQFRSSLSNTRLAGSPSTSVIIRWLSEVGARIDIGDRNWIGSTDLSEVLVEPIARWLEGTLPTEWFEHRLQDSPMKPTIAS